MTVIAITGAGRGIGAATAAALARDGHTVIIGDLDAEAAQAVAARLGPPAIALPVDVTDLASFSAFLDEAEAAAGPVGVLINNAGIMPVGPFLDETPDVAGQVVDVNLHGVLHGSKLALERMVPRGSGHLINISSQAGRVGAAGAATYSATKAAVITLTSSLQLEYDDSGVDISCVMPGVVKTELSTGLAHDSGVLEAVPPEAIADAIASCVARPRPTVHVPRLTAVGITVLQLLPMRVRRVIERLAGMEKIALRAADSDRSDYEERIAAARR